MNPAFDLLLAAALLWSAWRALASARLDHAVVMFIVFGLLMVIAWTRLAAVDVGLAEAAIGAGLTGALLLDAVGLLRRGRAARGERPRRGLAIVVAMARRHPGSAIAVAALLPGSAIVAAMTGLAPAAVDLRAPVAAQLPASGVDHAVTAVLLNFRGYDTLLEVAVLLIALLGLLAAAGRRRAAGEPADPVVRTLARIAAPPMVLVAGYLLWAGSFRPGGAFQAGAVLAGGAVLMHLAGLLPGWPAPRRRLRALLAAGFGVFLAVAAALLAHGALLRYPPAHAGLLILLIEAVLSVSLGAILAGLFLFLSRDAGDA